jgi:hypothetical protein
VFQAASEDVLFLVIGAGQNNELAGTLAEKQTLARRRTHRDSGVRNF